MDSAESNEKHREHEPMEVDHQDDENVDESFHDAEELADCDLDCYPYTFTPLLLFAQSNYFDKGYSNYNSVAQFFSHCLPVNMLENVLFDRKNMLYETLLDYVIKNEILVTCCIDAHFTALKVLSGQKGLYYDPLKPRLYRVTGDSFRFLLTFLLLKCNYGDSQHIQDNTDHYTGVGANSTRRTIYKLWRKINMLESASSLHGVQWGQAPLNLDRYLLINDQRNPRLMSVQLTSNTCYFQTYL
jgi:hypothetical protein